MIDNKRLVEWHTIKSFDVYGVPGNVENTIKLLQDAVHAAKLDYPGLPLQADVDIDYCSDNRRREIFSIQVQRPENDEEYNKRMVVQQVNEVNEAYARKRSEELKKRLEEA
jgi:hypothetical protein